jgi:hypothetical protein
MTTLHLLCRENENVTQKIHQNSFKFKKKHHQMKN